MNIAAARWALCASLFLAVPALADDLTHFESAPVHPVDMSASGNYLFVTHTADHRLVIFDLNTTPPKRVGEVMVGLEPVTVRVRDGNTVWVVNHISDSISIVDIASRRVVRTLLVGDEPTDVVFANNRAFVCVSEEDRIAVFNLQDLSQAPASLPLAMSDPRSLALSPDGGTLYVCALDSQNRTTIVPAPIVAQNGGLPAPNPPKNPSLPAAPAVGLIVRHNGTAWVDEINRSWNSVLPYTLLDNDIAMISTASPAVTGYLHGVGTTLFNIAVASNGTLFVTNQEASNQVRFEPNLRGRFVQNRVSAVIPGSDTVTPKHLNAHINYANAAGDAGERALSICIPTDITIAPNGAAMYVAAFGSHKVAVLNSSGVVTRRIAVGEGPCGLALDTARNRLYVFNRFDNTISYIDLATDIRDDIPVGFDPSPVFVREGRKFLYDGDISSAHGDLACASCHVFGTMDNIAWDLGNPAAAAMEPVPPGQVPQLPPFHPMKGPMTTQSLKGLSGTEPLHWRGDRAGFLDFNPAFVSLMGAPAQLSSADMNTFQQFTFSMRYPPNPFRDLSNNMPASINGGVPQTGENLFLTAPLDAGAATCVSCHALPTGENGTIIPGPLLLEPEAKKVPQLRNLYEKTRFDNTAATNVRGFGYTHDGAADDLFTFLQFSGFTFSNDQQRRDIAAYLLAFPTGTQPAVGAQWTMDGTNQTAGMTRLNQLQNAADGNVIGLVAKGRVNNQARGWVYVGGGSYRSDKTSGGDLSQSALLALAGAGHEITFTGVMEGTEWRLGVDRDADGFRDGDELDAHSDPGDPSSTPNNAPTGVAGGARTPALLFMAGPNPTSSESRLGIHLEQGGNVTLAIYDVRGALVRRLVTSASRPSGTTVENWDLRSDAGTTVSSGIYFARLEVPGNVITRRVTVVR
ncbi:MAG TPA: T9SS type A sorting domain-containing protein [Candidatus Krumholzibacteria bacterium]